MARQTLGRLIRHEVEHNVRPSLTEMEQNGLPELRSG
jgi:hypothetical protein